MRDLITDIQAKVAPLDGWCHPDKVELLVRLVDLFRPAIVVEVGVFAGKSLCALALAVKGLGLKANVIGVDSWSKEDCLENVVGTEHVEWWTDAAQSGKLEGAHRQAVDALDRLGLGSVCSLWHMHSCQAVRRFPEEAVSMLHIDGNHSAESARRDVEEWLPKLTRGGVLIMDDVDWPSTAMAQIVARQRCRELYARTQKDAASVTVMQKE